jgi:hypothetical protein
MIANPPMTHNFGALPIMRVGGKDESLIRFDLASIPSASGITSATLKLYVNGGASHAPVNVHRATAPWTESTVSFASFAQHFDAAAVGTFLANSHTAEKTVDLTDQVKRWVMGAQPNDGLLLETSAHHKTIIVTKEGWRDARPRLEVCYVAADDHCAPNPCLNDGTCENQPSGYLCHCPPGFTGTLCETPIQTCASHPCANGATCVDGQDGFTCSCPPGFTGITCEINIDDCANAPCQNGGVCQDGVASYTCSCLPGYTGTNCETLIDNCAALPCQNGGACTNGVNSYTCACPAGFQGANCEINVDDCAGQPCHNGGTCVDGVNAYTCSCSPDWGGPTCDVDLTECSQQPCLNGASCANGFGTYTCTCAPGYTGTNCEIDINDCAPNPCQNGGTCIDGVNAHTCTCALGFGGANCETPPQSCREILARAPASNDGLYTVYPGGAPTQVFCDMHTDGGGWTSVFIGANGSPNVFDHFDAGQYLGTFADPASGQYLQRAPASIAGQSVEIAVSCGGAMVKFPATTAVTSWLTTGTESGWAQITPTAIGGTVTNLPTWVWTGDASSASFVVTKDKGGLGNTFASSYSANANYDYCDGVSDQTSVVRVLYREAAPTPVNNTQATAGASCQAILLAGQSQGDGVYWLTQGANAPYQSYCDMTTDGGGWTTVFAGRNGSTNVFDHFDGAGYVEACGDPALHCLRRAPPLLADSAADVAVSCGDSMVKFAATNAVTSWLTAGTQAGWAQITPAAIKGAIASLPNDLWTGSGSDQSFVLAKDMGPAGNTFASSYSTSATFDDCAGSPDQASLVRILYREVAPAPVKNTAQAAAASCNAILLAGQSQGDGVYWLAQGGNPAYQAYCDMTSDGGGWTTVFAGRNGSPNVFDHFDGPSYVETCGDPASHCLRRAPADLATSAGDVAFSCGGAMVKLPATTPLTSWLTAGTQSGWVSVTATPILGVIPSLPNSLWTGNGATTSFVLAKDQSTGGTFAASYSSTDSAFDFCNGQPDQASLVRVLYR